MSNRPQARELTKKQVELLKKDLLTSQEEISNKARKVDLSTSPDDLADEADLASSDMAKGMQTRLGNREILYLKKVSEALERMDEGSYGRCGACDAHIGYGRLQARPTAELCINCKEEQEKMENLSVHKTQHKSLGRGLGTRI